MPCAGLRGSDERRRVAVAGVVLVRQRPGTAKGVVFITLEDETGIANAVVWPTTFERFRRIVMGARLICSRGGSSAPGGVTHVVVETLEDRSDWLRDLSPSAAAIPGVIAGGDEAPSHGPGNERSRSEPPRSRHPRDVRIMPKSRDFH